jgi:hypothetical protein
MSSAPGEHVVAHSAASAASLVVMIDIPFLLCCGSLGFCSP